MDTLAAHALDDDVNDIVQLNHAVHGVGDVGAIHQRVIATDPGSASNSLRSFNEQIQSRELQP